MAPSQTRLVLSAITGEKLLGQSIDFWHSVYGASLKQSWLILGFDMSGMRSVYYDQGIVEPVAAEEVVTNECIIRVCPGFTDNKTERVGYRCLYCNSHVSRF